jgi:CHAD domain-containing protein
MISGDDFAEFKEETKWLAGELDAARNLDVFIQDTFRPAEVGIEDRSAFAKLGAHLLEAQTDAYGRALAAVESPRYAKLLHDAAAWLVVGAWTRSDEPVLKSLRERGTAEFARERLDRLRRQVLKRGRKLASLDAPSRHRLRIKAKKLRYAAEFFADCFGNRATKKRARFLSVLEDLQDYLGRLNDIVVAHHLAADLVQGQLSDIAFAAGLVAGSRQVKSASIGETALQAFAAFESAKPFWH